VCVVLAALFLLLALAPCALCCVLVCLIHPRRGRLSRVIGKPMCAKLMFGMRNGGSGSDRHVPSYPVMHTSPMLFIALILSCCDAVCSLHSANAHFGRTKPTATRARTGHRSKSERCPAIRN
jgi:hypothetical protein